MKKITTLALVAFVGVAIIAVAPAPAAEALHLQLDASMPAAGQTLEASPEKIVLEFSERPELAVARVAIDNAKLGKITRSEEDETILWVAVEEPLAAGTHTVNWVTSSGDGHPVTGEFSFTVSARR